MSPMSVVYGHGCYPTSPNQNTYTNYLYPKFCYSLATFDQVFPSLLTPTSIMGRLIWIASNSSFSWKKMVGVLDVFEDQDRFTLAHFCHRKHASLIVCDDTSHYWDRYWCFHNPMRCTKMQSINRVLWMVHKFRLQKLYIAVYPHFTTR